MEISKTEITIALIIAGGGFLVYGYFNKDKGNNVNEKQNKAMGAGIAFLATGAALSFYKLKN